MIFKTLAIALFAVTASSTAFATEFIHDIQIPNFDDTKAASKIELPVSYDFQQYDTNLCWAYTAAHLIETRDRIKHPDRALYLSRRWFQYNGMKTRFDDLITGKRDEVSESGWPVDALRIATDQGLLQYHDVANSDGALDSVGGLDYHFLRSQIVASKTPADVATQILSIIFGLFPTENSVRTKDPATGQIIITKMTPLELRDSMIGNDSWIAVIPSDLNQGKSGWDKHIAPDLRSNTPDAYYEGRDAVNDLILASLKKNAPVGFCTAAHCAMIFGAALDAQGAVLAFKIQNSNFQTNMTGLSYYADPVKMKPLLVELTVLREIVGI